MIRPMVAPGPGKRRGGALFPVLILSLILLMLATMLPQVLVSASQAMKTDVSRDQVLEAAESGIAFAEAQLKLRLRNDLGVSQNVTVKPFTTQPSFDNPDFGQRKPVDFETRLTTFKKRETRLELTQELHRYTYKMASRAWNQQGRQVHVDVTGTMTAVVKVDMGHGGMAIRVVDKITTEAFGREKQN